MTTRRVQFALVAVLATLMASAVAQPQTPAQPPMIGGLGGSPASAGPGAAGASLLATDPVAEFQALAPQLNLRPDQQAKIKNIADIRRPVLASAEKMLGDAMTVFRQAADAGNEGGIRMGAARIGQYLGEVQALRCRTAADMRAVLAPDQTARLQQLKLQAEQRQREMAAGLQRLQEQMQQAQRSVPVPQPAPAKPKP
jgi:hypothetical protein